MAELKKMLHNKCIPAGTWRKYNVASTSMQRHDVASTLRRRYIYSHVPAGISAIAISLRWASRGPWATCSFSLYIFVLDATLLTKMCRLYRKNDHLWSFFYIIYTFFVWIQHCCFANTVFALDPSSSVIKTFKRLWCIMYSCRNKKKYLQLL